MWSRLASRVLWPIDEFECPDEQALYDGVRALPWHEHITPEMTLAVDAHVSGDKITHARFAAQRIKDAIVDRMRDEGLTALGQHRSARRARQPLAAQGPRLCRSTSVAARCIAGAGAVPPTRRR